jgi:acyl carrier protein
MVTGLRFGWGGTAVPNISGKGSARDPVIRRRAPLKTHYRNGSGAPTDRAHEGHEVAAMSDVGERVKKIVVEHLGVEADKVTENASFIDDLGADSLDTVELVMAFEEEFGCEIPDDAAETILTVGDAIKFLEKNAKS